jgi:hypothetical protein
MKTSLHRRKVLLSGLVAMAVAAAATPVLAAGQSRGATADTYAINSSFETPVTATEAPPPPEAGPNPGEAVRVDMQYDPQSFATMGKHFPPAPGAGNVAGVDSSNVAVHGRGGYDPALVQLQAMPQPFPWIARQKGTSNTTASARDAR